MKRIALLACMAVLVCLTSVAHSQAAAPIRVMLLDGQSGGAYHAWRLTTPALKQELEETGRFEVTVVTSPTSDGDFSQFHPDFSRYQVIVLNYDGPDWPADLRSQFEGAQPGFRR